MKGLAKSSLRVGKYYKMINLGEVYHFKLMQIVDKDFILKDANTLEKYKLSKLTEFGEGRDYEIIEI